jgi:hypothetical protein
VAPVLPTHTFIENRYCCWKRCDYIWSDICAPQLVMDVTMPSQVKLSSAVSIVRIRENGSFWHGAV